MDYAMMELIRVEDIVQTYDIYQACMYLPTKVKFLKKIEAYVHDEHIRVFACKTPHGFCGVMTVRFTGDDKAEIIGIAAEASMRRSGIGSFMIRWLAEAYSVDEIYAETDDDAVGFYRKNGFCITKTTEVYDGQCVIRYLCKLKKDQ